MTKRLIEILGVKEHEIRKLKIFLLYSLGIGISISFLYALASSLFIQHYEIEDLPYVYLVGGVIGYSINVVLSLAYKRISFKSISFIVLGLVTVIACSFTYFLITEIHLKEMVYWLYISTIPIVILLTSSINGAMVRYLDLEQNKRLSGIINSGEIIASILSFFSIPILIQVIGSQSYLLIFAVLGSIIALVAYLKLDASVEQHSTAGVEDSVKHLPYSEKYFWLVLVFILVSGTMAFIVNYEFLGVLSDAKRIYSETWVLSFLGIFFGLTQCVEFLLSFFSGKLLARYGINFGIKIIPVLLVITCTGSLFAILFGSFWMYFILVMLVKFFERIFRTAIERPASAALYQIFSQYKFRVQQFMDGQIQNLTSIVSGLILIAIILFVKSDQDIVFNYTWSSMSIIWFILSVSIIIGFKKRLLNILSKKRKNSASTENFPIQGSFGFQIKKPTLCIPNEEYLTNRDDSTIIESLEEFESTKLRLKYLLEINRFLLESPFYEKLQPAVIMQIKNDLIKLSRKFSDKHNLDDVLLNLIRDTPKEVKIFSLELINNFTGIRARLYMQGIFPFFEESTIGSIGLRKELRRKYRFSKIMKNLIQNEEFSPLVRYKAILTLGENYVLKVPKAIRNATDDDVNIVSSAAKKVIAADAGSDYNEEQLDFMESLSKRPFFQEIPLSIIHKIINQKSSLHENTKIERTIITSGFIVLTIPDKDSLHRLNDGLLYTDTIRVISLNQIKALTF